MHTGVGTIVSAPRRENFGAGSGLYLNGIYSHRQ